jgi:hypothetical protein
VRGAVNFFTPTSILPRQYGEEALEEILLIFFLLSLPLRERTKVRGAVNFFTSTSILPHQWGGSFYL